MINQQIPAQWQKPWIFDESKVRTSFNKRHMDRILKLLPEILKSVGKNCLSCTFASGGPGVPLITKTLAEMDFSDDLRSELRRLFPSESV